MSDDFADQLLTGDDKWWEFLDPQTYEVRGDLPEPTWSSADQLDWSRKKTRRRGGPVGFAYSSHCMSCGQGVPPDFTFCVHCGGLPRSASPERTFTIVIAQLDDEGAREMAGELIVEAGHELEPGEVDVLFEDLPVVFNVSARQGQIAALTAKFAQVGIAARGFPVDDPSVPWLRETAESIVRKTPVLLAVLGLVAGGIIVAWFWSVLALLGAVAVVVALFVRELRWYRDRYHVDVHVILQLLNGFDPLTAEVARDTLRMMNDGEARASVTVCLMEYYTLTHQIRAHGTVYGGVLRHTGDALEELMADVLTLAHRYAKMDDFLRANPPAALRQRLQQLEDVESRESGTTKMARAEREALQKQLETIEQMEQVRAHFRERLAALARAMESMRVRFAAVRAQPSEESFRSLEFDEALRELDEEFEVFEETMAVVG